MKANAKENARFFTAEAEGLAAIAQTKTIRTPKVLCTGTDDGEYSGYSFLLMEAVTPAPQRPAYWKQLARSLAAMHRADTGTFVTGGTFGFTGANFIGAGDQKNDPCDSWIPFFRTQRLEPQLQKADRYFDDTFRKKADAVLRGLESLLVEPERPSLLHGDLWSGNVLCGPDGEAWLIDPAVYVGCAEADIAMTELFGGFPAEFYDEYRKEGLLADGYEDRRDLYNLYHLLNHLNLFGTAYLEPVREIVDEYASAL